MRPGNSWWLISIAAVLLMWLLDASGLFRPMDRVVYDQAERLRTRLSSDDADVLLVYLPEEQFATDPDSLVPIVEQMRELGAARIGIAHHLPHIPAALGQHSDIVFGRRLRYTSERPKWYKWRSEEPESWALLQLPEFEDGTLRWQNAKVEVNGASVSTLELAMSDFSGKSAPFYVHFRGPPGSLPHVDSRDIQQGNLVRSLIQGKHVLIGAEPSSESAGLVTPTTLPRRTMTVLEFHGHGVNTLLQGRQVYLASPFVRLGMYFLVAFPVALLLQHCDMRWAIILFPVVLALDVVVATINLLWLHMWLPIVPLVAVHLVSLGAVLQQRLAHSQTTIDQLLLELSEKLRRRRWPTGFFSAAEPWPQIVSFIHQMLNLNRLIILEHPRDAFHVREVHAFHCSLSDIDERRRDYRRWPYAAAVEEGKPLLINKKRPYLTLIDELDESQYLVPLLFSGEMFGFMAVGVCQEQLVAMPDFEARLQDFASQIAELLYRREAMLNDQANSKRWQRWINDTPEKTAYAELTHAVHVLDRRLIRLERMFDKSDTASAIYDLFGRLLMSNERMFQLLKTEDISSNELTTVDLVARLTGYDLDAARAVLRQVVIDAWPESIPVVLDNHEGAFVLNIRPLQLESPNTGGHDAPLEVQGILCELVDRSSLMDMYRVKDELTENLGNSLRDELAAVDLVAKLLAADGVSSEERENYGNVIHERIEDAVSTLHECQRYLTTDTLHDWKDCFPVSAGAALQQAIASVKDQANRRGIDVPWIDGDSVQVFAAPKLLPRVFRCALQLVLVDARDDSGIHIEIEEKLSDIELRFSNQGYGFPIDQLESSLRSPDGSSVAELQKLREAMDWVTDWGGRLSVSSQIGTGTSVKLVLRRFE